MLRGMYSVPKAYNEPIKSYAPGSPEKQAVKKELAKMRSKVVDIPMFIGGQEITTDDKRKINPPHDHQHLLGYYNYGTEEHVHMAINAALDARQKWQALPWDQRASIFLKAADLSFRTLSC